MLNFACAAGTECMFPCCAFPFVLCDEAFDELCRERWSRIFCLQIVPVGGSFVHLGGMLR